ncbi:MFS transporter [Planomonospora sp. ID91781]|uniref:MFS transporter n=1 Tax=Planomonospora sp. ID91781 TaxID=2738135 RepID=UPI0018C3F1FA|nr:MFS transporter [Planomonospora sp. ID91781]MBG0822465.1 MFS transporter [Planomonospora sp. ID91781]
MPRLDRTTEAMLLDMDGTLLDSGASVERVRSARAGEHGRRPGAAVRDGRGSAPGERRVVRQVGFAQAALGFTVNSLGACLVLLARDLGVHPGELAWLSSSFGAGLLAVGAAGPLVLRPGPRPALLTAALVAAAGAALLAVAPVEAAAATGALLLGLGAAGLVLVTPALLHGPDAAARLARANAAASVSALLGPPAIGALDAAGANGRLALLLAVPPLLFLAADSRARPPVDSGARDRRPPAGPRSSRPEADAADRAHDSSPAHGFSPAHGPSRAHDPSPVRGSYPAQGDGGGSGPPVGRRAAGAWAAIVAAVSMEFCFTIWATTRLQDTGLTAAAAAATATAFLVGMAAGRLAAPRLLGRGVPVVPLGCGFAAAGTLAVALTASPAPVAAGLLAAGLGIAPLYPVTLARLVQVPGLTAARSAAYGALASGTAILAAPAALAALGAALDLRTAFLVTVPPLAAVLAAASWPRARPE